MCDIFTLFYRVVLVEKAGRSIASIAITSHVIFKQYGNVCSLTTSGQTGMGCSVSKGAYNAIHVLMLVECSLLVSPSI